MTTNLASFSSRLSVEHLLFYLRRPSSKKLLQIQAQIFTNPDLLSDHPSLLPEFIACFSRLHDLPRTSLLLRQLSGPSSTPDILSAWSFLIRSAAERSSDAGFLAVYRTMLLEGLRPDRATFTILLRHCTALSGAADIGGSVHCQIFTLGLGSDRFLQTALLNFYSKCGSLGSAERVFDEMGERDVIAHNAMIAALSCHGQVNNARRLFEQMPERSSASWNSMITCYCKENDLNSAREIFDRNPVKDIVSWNAMIDGYSKMGQLLMARELFDRLGSAKNSVTWNTMISGYLHHREFAKAISMFRTMQMENVKPTEVTMVSLLSACAHLGALKMGRWIHAYIQNHHLKFDVVVGNALIDMYFKCGSIDAALEVFCSMPMRNIFCWNSVIAGLGTSGYVNRAIEVFLDMIRTERIRPDGVTFVGLLSGCSHSGLVSEGATISP